MTGLISHIEILTEKPQKAGDFYGKVFGWKIKEYKLGGQDYVGWTPATETLAGGFRKPGTGGRSGTVNYVKVRSIDEKVAMILKRGGTVVLEKTQISGIGYMAQFIDPFGNLLGLFEPETWT